LSEEITLSKKTNEIITGINAEIMGINFFMNLIVRNNKNRVNN
jgi:hypothetical protein